MKKPLVRALIALLGLLLTGTTGKAASSPADEIRHREQTAREDFMGQKSAMKAKSSQSGRDLKEAEARQAEKGAAARGALQEGVSAMKRNRRARGEEMEKKLQAGRQEMAGMKREMGASRKRMQESAERMRQQNEQDRHRLQKMRDETRKDRQHLEERTPGR